MRIALLHESWMSSGAARCALDLHAALRRCHDVLFLPPDGVKGTPSSTLDALARFKPEVVNCHAFYNELPYGILSGISRLYPTCFTVHDPRPIGTLESVCWECAHNAWCVNCPLAGSSIPKPWNWYARRRLASRIAHWRCSPDLVMISPSQWLAGRLAEQELRRFRIETIPNGIDMGKFRPAPACRDRFGLPAGVPVLLHLAVPAEPWTVNDRKGLPYLADAFVNAVLPRFPSAVLAVAGERVVPNHPNVKPLGHVAQQDLPDLLRACDIFVSATLADNLPYTIIEAMACGKPVVAFAVGGVPEQIVDGQTGRLTPPKDAAALGEALLDLLSSEGKLAAFGRAARLRAEQLYSIDGFVARYETLYAEMAARRAAP
jgi:glycosyltransferase involved in cell wall biosynthesis